MEEISNKIKAIHKLDLSDKEREDLLFIVGQEEAIAADQIIRKKRNQTEVKNEYQGRVNWEEVEKLVRHYA